MIFGAAAAIFQIKFELVVILFYQLRSAVKAVELIRIFKEQRIVRRAAAPVVPPAAGGGNAGQLTIGALGIG